MSERYTRVFHSDDVICYQSAPVIIEARALLNDNSLDKVIAQIKLKNIQSKKINAVYVTVKTSDSAKCELESFAFSYLDLDAERDKSFGHQTIVELENYSARYLDVELDKVVFSDETIWENHSSKEIIKTETLINKFCEDKLVLQYQKTFGTKAIYVPTSVADIWRCSCGAYNAMNEAKCHICKNAFDLMIKNLDVNKLKAEYMNNTYIRAKKLMESAAKLMESAKTGSDCITAKDMFISAQNIFESISDYEDSAQLAEYCHNRSIQANKKARKSALIVVSSIAALIIIVLAINVIGKEIQYQKAISLIADNDYKSAIIELDNLDSYRDSNEQLIIAQNKYSDVLMDYTRNGDYQTAIDGYRILYDMSQEESIGTHLALSYIYNNQYEEAEKVKICDYLIVSRALEIQELDDGEEHDITNIYSDLKSYDDEYGTSILLNNPIFETMISLNGRWVSVQYDELVYYDIKDGHVKETKDNGQRTFDWDISYISGSFYTSYYDWDGDLSYKRIENYSGAGDDTFASFNSRLLTTTSWSRSK